MQTVLNLRERDRAFFKFLFFFVITVCLVSGAIYFDMRIPSKENEVLREQVSRYRMQSLAQEKFANSMDHAKILIDSLRQPGVNSMYLNQQIAVRLRELTDLQYKDSSIYGRMNKNILDLYLRYQDATNKVVSMGDIPRQLDDYKSRYEQTQRDLDQARRDLDLLRRANTAAGY
jgi:Type VI secretion system, TssO